MCKLAKSLWPKAPILLKALQAKHKFTDARGDPIPDAYNRVEMFLELGMMRSFGSIPC